MPEEPNQGGTGESKPIDKLALLANLGKDLTASIGSLDAKAASRPAPTPEVPAVEPDAESEQLAEDSQTASEIENVRQHIKEGIPEEGPPLVSPAEPPSAPISTEQTTPSAEPAPEEKEVAVLSPDIAVEYLAAQWETQIKQDIGALLGTTEVKINVFARTSDIQNDPAADWAGLRLRRENNRESNTDEVIVVLPRYDAAMIVDITIGGDGKEPSTKFYDLHLQVIRENIVDMVKPLLAPATGDSNSSELIGPKDQHDEVGLRHDQDPSLQAVEKILPADGQVIQLQLENKYLGHGEHPGATTFYVFIPQATAGHLADELAPVQAEILEWKRSLEPTPVVSPAGAPEPIPQPAPIAEPASVTPTEAEPEEQTPVPEPAPAAETTTPEPSSHVEQLDLEPAEIHWRWEVIANNQRESLAKSLSAFLGLDISISESRVSTRSIGEALPIEPEAKQLVMMVDGQNVEDMPFAITVDRELANILAIKALGETYVGAPVIDFDELHLTAFATAISEVLNDSGVLPMPILATDKTGEFSSQDIKERMINTEDVSVEFAHEGGGVIRLVLPEQAAAQLLSAYEAQQLAADERRLDELEQFARKIEAALVTRRAERAALLAKIEGGKA